MAKDTELLPWILGGSLLAIVAIASGIALTNTTVSSSVNLQSHVPSHVPSQVPIQVAAIASPPVAPPTIPTRPAVQPTAHVGLPPGNIWECVLNGQRTFSDAPCGERPSIRQLSELNLMDSTGIPPAVLYDPPRTGYAPAPDDQIAPDSLNDTYSNLQVISINERKWREHTSRHVNHFPGRSRSN